MRALVVLLVINAMGFVTGGCALGFQLGGTVGIDSQGTESLLAEPGLKYGFLVGDDQAVVLAFNGRFGGSPASSRGLLGAWGGFDYVHQDVVHHDLGLRGGIRWGMLAPFDGDGSFDQIRGVIGTEVAALLVLDHNHFGGHEKWGGSSDTFWNLAVSLAVAYIIVDEPDPPALLFTLGIAYELNGFSELF